MTAAEREAKKTLHGEWRTPIPINFVDDEEKSDNSGKRFYRGAVRDNIRLSVDIRHRKTNSGEVKIERHITLYYYARDDNGIVDLNQELYQVQGRATLRYDKIKWDNGCVWCRHGTGMRDKEAAKREAATLMKEDSKRAAPPPDDDDLFAAGPSAAQKRFQPAARHFAAVPDWDAHVAEVRKVMIEQLKEVEAKLAQKEAALAELPDQEESLSLPRTLAAEAAHGAAPPEQDEDTEVTMPAGKVLIPDGQHAMFCCGALCGSKPKVNEDDGEGEGPLIKQHGPNEPLPEARDILKEGFFCEEELDDIIDRINDHVGIWGVSEATEREFIKPPVVAMNKLVASAMATFMDNPLMDLITFLMDDHMDFSVKCIKIGNYINDNFVKPLCNALVDGLSNAFQAIKWIKNQVKKVIAMMTQMVTDQVVTKSVEAINESDVVD